MLALLTCSGGLGAQTSTRAPAAKHIFFIGDSITLHGPAPELGWNGTRGMAASRDDLDYVHRLAARFSEHQSPSPKITVHARGGGTLADKLADSSGIAAQARDADLVVIQLGENDHDVSASGFREPYERLLRLVRITSPSARIVCTGVWAPPQGDRAKDDTIRELCARHGALFADLGAANSDPLNRALATGLWTHAGVNWHPSDAGMQAYADTIWNTLSGKGAPALASAPSSLRETGPSPDPIHFDFSQNNPAALATWSPAIGVLVDTETGHALQIRSSGTDGAVMIRHTLNPQEFHGRAIQISARIRATDVSTPPEPWNGVKVRLDIQDAEGKHDYPQAFFEANHTGWQTVSFTRRIPANTTSLALDLGLERVSGLLWIQEVNITFLP